jgi:activator of HSP90 ATPase
MTTITRRNLSLFLGAFGAASAEAQPPKNGTAIHQEIDFKTTPKRIYEALLDAKQFKAFSTLAAEIQPEPGGSFKLFEGRIVGRNVELVPNQRIVQAWRSIPWPPGVYSLVKFELTPRGEGTRVILDHSGFTEEKWGGLNEGWKDHYWEPLHKYLNA